MMIVAWVQYSKRVHFGHVLCGKKQGVIWIRIFSLRQISIYGGDSRFTPIFT
jgi:hypothetical protein